MRINLDRASAPTFWRAHPCRPHERVSHILIIKAVILKAVLKWLPSDINIYDRRFLPFRPVAVQNLTGHINTCSHNLGLDVLDGQVVAAAGEDKQVRLWSLRTGEMVKSTEMGLNLFSKTFDQPVPALKFQSGRSGEIYLWVADGAVLRRFNA